MIIQFRNLFTLDIVHGYYRDGCQDFDFVVPADTGRQLQNGKLLAKVRDGRLFVLFEANEADAPLASIAGAKLRFGLKLLNPHFSNFTRLDFDLGAVKALYRNGAAPTALNAPVTVVMMGTVFCHKLTKPDRPATIVLRSASGHALRTETVTATDDRTEVTFDLSGQSPGAYSVEETFPGDNKTTAIYFDPELLQVGVFGIVEITLAGSFYAAAPAFQVSFSAREQPWKYYVVAKNYSEAEFNQLSVTDIGFAEDARPQVHFTKVAAADFTASELPATLLNPGGDRLVLFESQSAVPRQESPRKKMQLSKNGEVLIPHLPQPGADQASADLIVHIAKSKP